MSDDLQRFVAAQEPVYDAVLEELRRGRKVGHWIWFIFPQLRGLGSSENSRFYGVASLKEAERYLAHPVLGRRLRECARLVLGAHAASAEDIFGSLDARKVHSSMTLFHGAAPDDPVFMRVLERFYDGGLDERTVRLLEPVTGSDR
jgi:uncharacterized protein (DUF1810 family)